MNIQTFQLRFVSIMLIFISLFLFQSCSHYVANDYKQYLLNNQGRLKLEESDVEAYYYLTPETEQHDYRFRAWSVGYAQLWVVNFGDMLEKQLNSQDVLNAFKTLKKQFNAKNEKDVLLIFKLNHYVFSDFCAHIELRVIAKKNNINLIDKSYRADGKTQKGKMMWGGAFAMKNAIQQSTRFAINDILNELIYDLNEVKDSL